MSVILVILIISAIILYGRNIAKITVLDRAVAQRDQANEVIVNKFLTKAQPRDMGTEIVTQGNPAHKHSFKLADWDRNRFGYYLVDRDPDPGTQIAFPMGTWKELFSCDCGAEKIQSTRALM